MWKKILVYSLVISLFVSLAGCTSAETVAEGVIQSLYKIDTYQYDISVTVNMVGVIDGEETDPTVAIVSNCTVDNINKRMWTEMELAMGVTLPEEDGIVVDMEMYLIGNDSYILVEAGNETLPWLKERMPVGNWDETAKLNTNVALLEEAEVVLTGNEKIRGIDCHVVEIIPNEEKLFGLVYQETLAAEEESRMLPEELLRELVKNASVKQWVQKDTLFLAKTELIMDGVVPADIFQEGLAGMFTVNMTIDSQIYNYNKAVNIELPAEVEKADYRDDNEFWSAGEPEAQETEFANIQAAVHSMMVDNEIAWLPNPVTVATNDMGAFPDTSVCGIDKLSDWGGNAYVNEVDPLGDKDGYILFAHDITGDASQASLVNYVNTATTTYWYSVDADGTVTQSTTGP